MPKKVCKNSFEKMCDKLDENYIFNENEVVYVRNYIESNIKNDADMLLKIKAEALEDDCSVFQSIKIAAVAIVISTIGVCIDLLPKLENDLASLVISMFYLGMIMFTVIKILKELFTAYEKAQKENKQLFVIPARNIGRGMVLQMIDDFKNGGELTEHRCTCSRLLGRFSGQAEVKCPKCGKMNVIGVDNHADSGIAR